MRFSLVILPLLLLILTGCPGVDNKTKNAVEKNNMNLPNPKMERLFSVSYELSDVFSQTNYNDFTINYANSKSYSTSDSRIHFSIERFTDADFQTIQFLNEEKNQDNLIALRDYFSQMIQKQTYNVTSLSEPSESYTRTKKKGWIQSIQQETNNDYAIAYLIATIEYKGNYYIVQLISTKEIIPYLYDDFLKIVSSIK